MAKAQVHRVYQGESAEVRVGARRRRLLDVSFARLATQGAWRTTSIAQLCRDAELNKRYFYESFADLDAVVGAVVDDLAAELVTLAQRAASEAMASGMPTPALAAHVLGAVVDWIADDPRRARVLFAHGADHPHAVAQRGEVIATLGTVLTAFSLQYHRAPGPLPIAQVGSAMLVGGTLEILLAWLEGRLVVSRAELVEDLAALWVSVGDGAVALAKRRAAQT